MSESDDPFEGLRLELRRGGLILAVLAQLRSERHGYALRRALADAGLEIEEGALYPMLRRLEAQGLLSSEWREEDKRRKRFYRLAPLGHDVLDRLVAAWRDLNDAINRNLS